MRPAFGGKTPLQMAHGRNTCSSKAIIFLVTALLAIDVAMATEYTVGGSRWGLPTTLTYYSDWAATMNFVPGDSLVFLYTSFEHDVLEVSIQDYGSCYTGSPINVYVAGNDVVTLPQAGTYYFICGQPGHCAAGMSMQVTVNGPTPPPLVSYTSPPPPASPPAPAPTPEAPTAQPHAPATPPTFTRVSCPRDVSCGWVATLLIVIFAVLISIAGAVTILFLWRRTPDHPATPKSTEGDCHDDITRSPEMVPSAPREFTYRELAIATKSFSDEELLGTGGFGNVYRGILDSNRAVVAVKRIGEESRQGEREFLAEVSIISQIRHPNLVQLHGWCRERSNLLLVYEYMPNGSLDNILYEGIGHGRGNKVLGWSFRYNIVTGVAAALSYLHEEWKHCVLHRDIKPSNILLDADFNPHLGDFGLARSVRHNQNAAKHTAPAGTLGYMAPELPHTGRATIPTDVYGFGVLALEVVCGRRPLDMDRHESEISLVEVVWRAQESNNLVSVLDARLARGNYDLDQVMLILRIGLLCAHPDPCARPSMRKIRAVLHGDSELPVLPSSQPVLALSWRPKEQTSFSVEHRFAGHSHATTSSASSSNTRAQSP